MRIREINPAFFSSSDVIACSVPARLLFVGLWCIADREGRLLDDPGRIKRTLYPDQPMDPDALLEELSDKLIVRYEVDDVACIAIRNFAKYQHVHPKEAGSKLPPPPANREKEHLGGVKPGKGDVKPGGLSSLRTLRPSELTPLANARGAAADRVDFVGTYVDACREAGAAAVSESKKGRIGRAANGLRGDGHDDEAILAGIRELARRNASPALLEDIVGDIERVRSGTPIGRVIAPPVVVPTANPVGERIRAIREGRA